MGLYSIFLTIKAIWTQSWSKRLPSLFLDPQVTELDNCRFISHLLGNEGDVYPALELAGQGEVCWGWSFGGEGGHVHQMDWVPEL